MPVCFRHLCDKEGSSADRAAELFSDPFRSVPETAFFIQAPPDLRASSSVDPQGDLLFFCWVFLFFDDFDKSQAFARY